MCGFVGGMLQRPLEDQRLDRALEVLHHRGPDAVGKWVSDDQMGQTTIIGVVDTVRHYGLAADTRPAVFYPHRGRPTRSLFGVIGVSGETDVITLTPAVLDVVSDLSKFPELRFIDRLIGGAP